MIRYSVPAFLLLACIGLPEATASCDSGQWQCPDGRCIPDSYLCDGGNDCGDNSDETMCNLAAEGSLLGLPTDASVHLQLVLDRWEGSDRYSFGNSLMVALCGAYNCSGLALSGLADIYPSAGYMLTLQSNNLGGPGQYGQYQQGVIQWLPDNMVLEVKKHNRLLGLWPSGQPQLQRWLQVEPDHTNLVVSCLGFASSRLLQSGEEVAQGPVLQPGQVVTLQVVPHRYTRSRLYVGLCGAAKCAAVVISSARAVNDTSPSMAYGSGFTITNSPDDAMSPIIEQVPDQAGAWRAGRYNFTVALHPDGFLQVWQDTDNVAEVPILAAQQQTLKAVFSGGNVAFTALGARQRHELPRLKMSGK